MKKILSLLMVFSLVVLLWGQTTVTAAVLDLTISSGSIYTIKNQKSNLYLDVKGYSSSPGTRLQQFTWHGDTNQQFWVNRISEDIYELEPVVNYSLRVEVKAGSTSNGAVVQTNNKSGSSAQRFKIVPDGNNLGAYKILTGSSNYTKCLTVENGGTSIRDWVVQYAYSNQSSNHWFFERQDDINVYQTITYQIPVKGRNRFIIDFKVFADNETEFQKVPYVLETIGNLDAYLELYRDDVKIAENDDSGEGRNAKLVFTPTKSTGYRVEVRAWGDYYGVGYLKFSPQNELHFNSMTGSINTVADVKGATSELNRLGYHVTNHINSNLSSINRLSWNNNNRINNDYYMISSHGSLSGTVWFDDSDYMTLADIPNMSNVLFSVWAICYGGAPGNAAETSISRGSNQALGWPGLTYVGTSKTFTNRLWSEIADGATPRAAVNAALTHTRESYFWNEIFGWGNDTIIDPRLYTDPNISMFSTNEYEKVKSSVEYNNVFASTKADFEAFKSNNDHLVFTGFDESYQMYIKTINGLITNEYYIVDKTSPENSLYKSIHVVKNDGIDIKSKLVDIQSLEHIILSKKKVINNITFNNSKVILDNLFYLNIDGQTKLVKRMQIEYSNGVVSHLDEVFVDVYNNKIIPNEVVINAFSYIK